MMKKADDIIFFIVCMVMKYMYIASLCVVSAMIA